MIRTSTSPPLCVTWGVAPSPVGKIVIGMTEKGEICRLDFLQECKLEEVLDLWQAAWPRTEFTKGTVADPFSDRPILLVGTVFQHQVWRAMAKIPAGNVSTYGEIARSVGKARAARAVGAACGANPVPYLVPCHRVVAANGGWGGFSGGIALKKILLKREGYQPLSRS